MPDDEPLGELRAALLLPPEEDAVEKLKQVLACVVQAMVVEGRDHIQPYSSFPERVQRSLRGGQGTQ